MAIPKIEHAGNAFAVAVCEPGIGDRIGRHRGRKSTLGKGLSVPFGGCPPASNCIEMDMTSLVSSGQKASAERDSMGLTSVKTTGCN